MGVVKWTLIRYVSCRVSKFRCALRGYEVGAVMFSREFETI
jgi:hypothetical protein